MLGDQLNISTSEEVEMRQLDLSAHASDQTLGDLLAALRRDERCWCAVDGLTHEALLEQAGQPLQNVSGKSAMIAINSTADRVSRDLKGQASGLSVSGLPSIQRVAHAGAYT